jgi:tRNA (guanine-N7-)-methyltransferase
MQHEAISDEDVESDPAAAILATATEESQKVARNKGSTYRACYRRLAELPL